MKNLLTASVLVATVIGQAGDAQAQRSPAHERILIPIYIEGQAPGAHGSLWVTRLVGYNAWHEPIQVTQYAGRCAILCPPIDDVPPNSSFTDGAIAFSMDAGRSGTGSFVHIYQIYSQWITFNLRVQDLSRQALTWGTELPVVRESEAFVDTLRLLNIPTDSRFRVAIRVYDFEPANGDHHARLRVLSGNNQLLAETTVALVPSLGSQDGLPGYAQLTDLVASFPQIAASETVRVEITPITLGLRFWAFASVTNNETQHVTTVTPQ